VFRVSVGEYEVRCQADGLPYTPGLVQGSAAGDAFQLVASRPAIREPGCRETAPDIK